MNFTQELPTVYIETTIPSFLTAQNSSDIHAMAKKLATNDWWTNYRQNYQLFISKLVIDEAKMGHPEAATRRLVSLEKIDNIEVSENVTKLAKQLISTHSLPEKSFVDAMHIAVATVHHLDYLLTWNCKHIANATMRSKIEQTCIELGYKCPILCTPEELM